jgi:rubrerythrin
VITKNDYLGYFRQLHSIEEKMANLYTQTMQQLKRPELRDVFSKMAEDERKHCTIVDELLQIVNSADIK